MKPDTRKRCLLQQRLERTASQIPRINRPSDFVREQKVVVLPLLSYKKALGRLPDAVAVKRGKCRLREDYATPTARGLWLPEAKTVGPALKSCLDLKRATVQVDIRPALREKLAKPHSGGESQDVESLKPLTGCGCEESSGLLSRQRLHFVVNHSGRRNEVGYVTRDQTPAHCLRKQLVQHSVEMPNSSWRLPRLKLPSVEHLKVLRPELGKGNPPELWNRVDSHINLIAVPGRWSKGWPNRLEPLASAEAIEHLDFAIREFREMKMQPSLERALGHREFLKA